MPQALKRNSIEPGRNVRSSLHVLRLPHSMHMASLSITPGRPLQGTISVPGDKSITHRAIILAALANGMSTVAHYSRGEDCLNTIRALQALGIRIDVSVEELRVYGRGVLGVGAPRVAGDWRAFG